MDFCIDIPFEKTTKADGSLELFGGIASSSAIDRDNECMSPKIMDKIASDLRQNTTVFLNHDTRGLAVGKVVGAEHREGKVFVKVTPTKALGMADVVTQINEGMLKSFSIGGKIKKYSDAYNEKLGKTVRTIEDVEVQEVSVVGVPSNPEASVLSHFSKSFQKGETMSPPSVVHPAVGGVEVKAAETVAVIGTPHAAGAEAHASAATGTEGPLSPPVLTPKDAGEHPAVMVMKMMKCQRCGALHKATFEAKPEPEGGPGEMTSEGAGYYKMKDAPKGDLEREESKKAFDVQFKKWAGEVQAAMAIEFTAREDVLRKDLAAANGRVELLQKSIDEKGKSLEAKQDEMQQSVETIIQKASVKAPAEIPSFFPKGITRKN